MTKQTSQPIMLHRIWNRHADFSHC